MGRSTGERNETTCAVACTPVSVRPAAATRTGASAIFDNAASSASCTEGACGWYWNPLNALPSYSTPSARFSSELLQHGLSALLLLRCAFGHHLVQDVPGAVLIAHVDVGSGQIELRARGVGLVGEIERIVAEHI